MPETDWSTSEDPLDMIMTKGQLFISDDELMYGCNK